MFGSSKVKVKVKVRARESFGRVRSSHLMRAFAILPALVALAADDVRAFTCVFPSSTAAFGALTDRPTVPTNLVLFSTEISADTPEIVATSSDGSDVVLFTPVDVGGMFRFERERERVVRDGNSEPRMRSRAHADERRRCPAGADRGDHRRARLLQLAKELQWRECKRDGRRHRGRHRARHAQAVLRRSVNGNAPVVADLQSLAMRQNHIGLVDHADEGGGAIYSVTAIDLAGNESEPTQLVQSLGCPGSCSQADVVPFAFVLAALFVRRRSR